MNKLINTVNGTFLLLILSTAIAIGIGLMIDGSKSTNVPFYAISVGIGSFLTAVVARTLSPKEKQADGFFLCVVAFSLISGLITSWLFGFMGSGSDAPVQGFDLLVKKIVTSIEGLSFFVLPICFFVLQLCAMFLKPPNNKETH
jgi:hypothetical protein